MDSEKEAYQEGKDQDNKSALQHNIESKGANAYYFAHAFKANGPVWDGLPEPRLLSKTESSMSLDTDKGGADFHHTIRGVRSSFDYSKSTITKYGFLDEGAKVKIYVDLPGVGMSHTDEQVQLDYTESSLSLRILNVDSSNDDCLSFGKLFGLIDKATVKLKTDRIIITLFKKKRDGGNVGDAEDNTVGDDTIQPTFDEWKTIGAVSNSNAENHID